MSRETDTERRHQAPTAEAHAATTEAPAEAVAAQDTTSFTSHGQTPQVEASAQHAAGPSASERGFGGQGQQQGGPEIDATKEAMGGHVVGGMQKANVEPGSGGQNDVHHGIHYWYNYQRQCE